MFSELLGISKTWSGLDFCICERIEIYGTELKEGFLCACVWIYEYIFAVLIENAIGVDSIWCSGIFLDLFQESDWQKDNLTCQEID